MAPEQPAAPLQGASTLASYASIGTAAAGCYGGSFAGSTVWPALLGVLFASCFHFALHRAAAQSGPKWTQLLLVLTLVVISFVLHLTYLPAGLFCFFALILCKNQYLLPPPRQKRE